MRQNNKVPVQKEFARTAYPTPLKQYNYHDIILKPVRILMNHRPFIRALISHYNVKVLKNIYVQFSKL